MFFFNSEFFKDFEKKHTSVLQLGSVVAVYPHMIGFLPSHDTSCLSNLQSKRPLLRFFN